MTNHDEFQRDREVIAAAAADTYADFLEIYYRAKARWPLALDALDAANKRIAELEGLIIKGAEQSDDQGYFCAFCPAMTTGLGLKDKLSHDPDCIVLTIQKEATDG